MSFLRPCILFFAALPLAAQAAPAGSDVSSGLASPEPATLTTLGIALTLGVFVVLRRKR